MRWKEENRLVPFCPEVAGGLPTPRDPAEITHGADASDVLDGQANILTCAGENVTPAFLQGARLAVEKARHEGCCHAILTDRSPSCGSLQIYDGLFRGQTKQGAGVTATLLARAGLTIWNENQIDALASELTRLEKEMAR